MEETAFEAQRCRVQEESDKSGSVNLRGWILNELI